VAVHPGLLTLDLAVLRLLDVIGAELLAVLMPRLSLLGMVRSGLLTHGLTLLDVVRPRLLAGDLAIVRRADALGARLLPRHLALLPHWANLFRPRGADSLPLGALRRALDLLAAALLHLMGLAAPAPVGALRSGRGRNRQGGDAGEKKYPGHHKNSFRTAPTVMPCRRSHC